jgi:hypothetical protein
MPELSKEETERLVNFLLQDELADAISSEPPWNEDEDWVDDDDEIANEGWGGCCLCGGDHFEDACPVYPEPYNSPICAAH